MSRGRGRSQMPTGPLALALFVLVLAVVVVAAYVYFSRYPEQAGTVVREVLGAAATEVAQPASTARPRATRPPATPRPATASGREALGETYPKRPGRLRKAEVVGVVDGDTIDVRLGGEEIRLRLIGINSPESVDPRRPVECYGVEASTKAKELLAGQTVYLEADASQDEQDRFGRLLRFVWLEDGRMFNLEMVAQGYAFEYTYDAAYKYQAEFRAAQAYARGLGAGLWSPATCSGESKPAE